jgi:hypothetical protein
MGTSSAFGGQGGNTPLVPSWLSPGGEGPAAPPPDAPTPPDAPAPPNAPPAPNAPAPANPAPTPVPPAPQLPPVGAPADPGRFTSARNNFSRFASSGGSDRNSLGRAVSDYVSKASGGSRSASQRIGSSRKAGARLLGVLSDAAGGNALEALRALNLENLAGRPIEEIFLGLMDYVCEGADGGSVDEGIAREAFIETIADLGQNGIVDFDSLTVDQVQTIFELYATHAIEARLYRV